MKNYISLLQSIYCFIISPEQIWMWNSNLTRDYWWNMYWFEIHFIEYIRVRRNKFVYFNIARSVSNFKLSFELLLKLLVIIRRCTYWENFSNWNFNSLCVFVRTFLLRNSPQNFPLLNLELKRYWYSRSSLIVSFFVLPKFRPTSHRFLHLVNTLYIKFICTY